MGETYPPRIHIKSPKSAPGARWEFSRVEYGSFDPLSRQSNEPRPRARRTKTLPKRAWDGFCNIVMDGADAAVDTAAACKKAYTDMRERVRVSRHPSLQSDEVKVLVPESSYIASRALNGSRNILASFSIPKRYLKILGGGAVLAAAGCVGAPHLAETDWSLVQPVTESFVSDLPKKFAHLGFYAMALVPLLAAHVQRQRQAPARSRERGLAIATSRW